MRRKLKQVVLCQKNLSPPIKTRLKQSFECNVEGKYMDTGSFPLNDFSTQFIGALAFLSLFAF